ncbi:ZCHC3 protein, partial [Atractosteus spatula]|nr:ZCHC3 protein [Atractosteus spatula]
MHDPFISDADVTTFLSRYVEVCEEPRRIMDRRNVWAGNRQYRVKLQADARSPDGFKHPPATFAIGSGRGYLYYRDQPLFCRKCRGFGHRDADCEITECAKCHSRDHSTRNCNIKECSLCGAEGHLYRQCTRRAMDYSRALRGEARLFGEDGEEDTSTPAEEGKGREREDEEEPQAEEEGREDNGQEGEIAREGEESGTSWAERAGEGLDAAGEGPSTRPEAMEVQDRDGFTVVKRKKKYKRHLAGEGKRTSSEGKKKKKEGRKHQGEASEEEIAELRGNTGSDTSDQEEVEDSASTLPPGQGERSIEHQGQISVLPLSEEGSPYANCLVQTPSREEERAQSPTEMEEGRSLYGDGSADSLIGVLSSSDPNSDEEMGINPPDPP